jgi:hypothetical protein
MRHINFEVGKGELQLLSANATSEMGELVEAAF